MAGDADWFVIVNDEIRGPFTADQMRTAAQKGLVTPATSVRKGPAGDWFRADQIKGLLPQGPPSLEPASAASPTETPTPVASAEQPLSPEADQPIIKPAVDDAPTSGNRRGRRRRRRKSNPIPVIVVAVCGVAVLLSMLFWLSRPAKVKPKVEAKPAESASR